MNVHDDDDDTSASNIKLKSDVDEFWEIALENPQQQLHHQPSDDDDDDDVDVTLCCLSELTATTTSTSTRHHHSYYYIPIPATVAKSGDVQQQEEGNTNVILKLSPLPKEDGAWSALGADAWFASAILSAILLKSLDEPSIISYNKNDNQDEEKNIGMKLLPWKQQWSNRCSSMTTITALELGSGAVGLSGLVLAMVLLLHFGMHNHHHHDKQQTAQHRNVKVLLTDCDSDVLQQLEYNVSSNQEQLLAALSSLPPPNNNYNSDSNIIQVQALDWNDISNNNNNNHSDKPGNSHHTLPQLDLVVGSELIYTAETARACANLLMYLLGQRPDLVILIVQVSDRPGFEDVFLPMLEREPNIQVQLESIPFATYEMATNIMSRSVNARNGISGNGTLDRHAFVSCWITNKKKK